MDKHGFKARDSVHQFCWAIHRNKTRIRLDSQEIAVKARELKFSAILFPSTCLDCDNCAYKYIYIYIYIPGTQITLVLSIKGLVFWGSNPQNKGQMGSRYMQKIAFTIYLHSTFHFYNSRWLELIYPNRAFWNCCHLHCWGQDLSPEMQKKRLEQEQAGWQKRKLHLWHSVYHHLANTNGTYFLNCSSYQLNFKKATAFFVNFAEFNPFNFDERAAIGPTSAR